MNIHPEVIAIKNYIISTRRDIHKHPELSFQEFRTSKLVSEQLKSFGIQVIDNVGKTGVVGILESKNKGPTIALRADMDALPINEKNSHHYIPLKIQELCMPVAMTAIQQCF